MVTFIITCYINCVIVTHITKIPVKTFFFEIGDSQFSKKVSFSFVMSNENYDGPFPY